MTWRGYDGERYLDWEEVEAWCHALAVALPDWVSLEQVGTSRYGRPLWQVVMGRRGAAPGSRPALWLDAGTHASEWTGVSALLFALSAWADRLLAHDHEAMAWFSANEIIALPCISPDGYDATRRGAPLMRSTLRPGRDGAVRSGLDPHDIDGDGAVRWMRWRHPAGPFVQDEQVPMMMRPRTLDDDPADAFFCCDEGEFVQWDGVRWVAAPLRHGLDLNRNFPSPNWTPFSMFGMDAGRYPLSEPESRAVTDAFAAHPSIALGLTLHTYTGCVLTQPYRRDSPLGKADIELMELLARDAVKDTTYDVFRVFPDFMYDPERPMVGVWADAMATTFGVPGYTVECWDPFKHAGVPLEQPAAFFASPDLDKTRAMLAIFGQEPHAVEPWRPFEHPQLGAVEIGGIDYLHTVRNAPVSLLKLECERVAQIIARTMRALPRVRATVAPERLADGLTRLRVTLENVGFLPTSGLERGEQVGACAAASITVRALQGVSLITQPEARQVDHLSGWGHALVAAGRCSIYPSLPAQSHRHAHDWLVRGEGMVEVRWSLGRAGQGSVTMRVGGAA